MKFAIISGSHRQPSQSAKVATLIKQRVGELFAGSQAEIIDLGGNPYPLWDQGIWEGDPDWTERLAEPRRILGESDGVVGVSPEWHGQVPAGLKNFFLLFGTRELGHKPAMIVTVSASEGGSYPVAELRMSSYKNNRLCYIPEHVIVKQVETVLNDDPSQNDGERDGYVRGRIDWTLGILNEYAKALKSVRESGLTSSPDYPFGM
jgi:NAD(P)H-dependent FMN reductase